MKNKKNLKVILFIQRKKERNNKMLLNSFSSYSSGSSDLSSVLGGISRGIRKG